MTYELARPEFEYWVGHLEALEAIRTKRDISVPKIGKAMAVTKSGQIIETKSADDIVKIAAQAPDGIIMAEAAQMSYEVYLKCVGRVAERRGWLLLSGTFEGSEGWYPEKFYDWLTGDNRENARSFSLPSWCNKKIYPGGREDPEIKRLEAIYARVEGLFEERCGAVPVPPTTLVFRDYRFSVHCKENVTYIPSLPVYLAVDPSSGGDPYCVLACQFPPYPYEPEKSHPDPIDYCHVIDSYYETKTNTEDIVAELRHRDWWKMVRGGAIDVESPDERRRWMKMGKIPLVGKKIDIFQGIRRLKSFLYYRRDPATQLVVEQPHLRISPRVTCLQYELSHYKRKVTEEESLMSLAVVDKPYNNQADHAIKALWYLLVIRYGDVKSIARGPIVTWKRKRL